MTICFELNGQQFIALNGGPHFKFTPAISFVIHCEGQEKVDEMLDKLTQNGGREEQCGWLMDKYGISWQVVPKMFGELMTSGDIEKRERVMAPMLKIKKLIIRDLQEA